MTISTSRGEIPTIKAHIVAAYRRLGIVEVSLEPSVAQLAFGRDMLEYVLGDINASSIQVKAQQFFYLSLTAGTRVYDLPEGFLDIVGYGMYIAASEADPTLAAGETAVASVTMDQWQLLGAKGSRGTPTKYWCNRQPEIPQVSLWLIPSEAGTIRFQGVLLPADADIDTATLELEEYWNGYILEALCAKIATGTVGIQRAGYHEQLAQQKFNQCLVRANEMVSLQGSVAHEGPHSGGRHA